MVQITVAGGGGRINLSGGSTPAPRGSFTAAPYEPGGALVHVPREPVLSANQLPKFAEPPPLRAFEAITPPTRSTPPPPTYLNQPLPNLANIPKPPIASAAAAGGVLELVGTTAGIEAAAGSASLVAASSAVATTGLGVIAVGLTLYNLETVRRIWQLSQPEPQFEIKPEYKDIGHAGELYNVEIGYEDYSGVGGYAPGSVIVVANLEAPIGDFIDVPIVTYPDGRQEGIGIENGSPTKLQITSATGRVARNKPFIATVTKVSGEPIQEVQQQLQLQRQSLQPTQYFPDFAEPDQPLKIGIKFAPTPQIEHEAAQQLKVNQEPQKSPYVISQPANTSATITNTQGQSINLPSTSSPSKIQVSSSNGTTTITQATTGLSPITFTSSGTSPVTVSILGQKPITIDPTGKTQPTGATQDLSSFGSKALTPQPSTSPTPTPTSPTPTTTNNTATKTDLDQFKKDLEKLILTGGLLAGLTPAIQAIGDRVNQTARQTTPEALETAAAAGTCRTTQPGGCTTKALDDAVGRVNQNTNNQANALDAANAAANLEQLKRLGIIDNKLGAQLPGGIGGALSRFVNWAVVDRITNIITMFGVLHNVMMLSNSVKETFLDILDNLLQTGYNIAPTIFKQADSDSAIDAREYIGGAINTFFGKLFGVSEWTALKAQWKAYSTIYSSSAQAYNNLREIHNDSQELLNMARNYTAELGNALVD